MPISFTGARDVYSDLLALLRSGLPGDVASTDRIAEDLKGSVDVLMLAEGQAASWAREARVGTAHGLWLDQHAKSLGTSRAAGETDDQLRARLRSAPDAVTPGAVLDGLQDVVDAGAPGQLAYLVEVPVDNGCFAGDGTTTTWAGFVAPAAATAGSPPADRVVSTRRRHLVGIVPFGLKAAAAEAIRQRRAAGRTFHVEEY